MSTSSITTASAHTERSSCGRPTPRLRRFRSARDTKPVSAAAIVSAGSSTSTRGQLERTRICEPYGITETPGATIDLGG
jgi:hypothetical protein